MDYLNQLTLILWWWSPYRRVCSEVT